MLRLCRRTSEGSAAPRSGSANREGCRSTGRTVQHRCWFAHAGRGFPTNVALAAPSTFASHRAQRPSGCLRDHHGGREVKRKVYPYSIVPGGAEDVLQAKRAMTDPAVKAHYANVDFSQLKQVKLAANLSGYVSYRWGDKIYWTQEGHLCGPAKPYSPTASHRPRTLPELLFRAVPCSPLGRTEPTEKALDAARRNAVTVYSFPKLPVLAPELPMPPGELTPSVPAASCPWWVRRVGKTPGGGFWFPLLPIIPPIHHHPSSPPSGPNESRAGHQFLGGPTPPVTPPVAVVPEPRYSGVLSRDYLPCGRPIVLAARTPA